MNARQFDGIAKALRSGAKRRGVLGLLGGGVVAALGGRGVALAHHKPTHCPKTERCKSFHVCTRFGLPHCDLGPGTGCSCVLSVEGCRTCIDENSCSRGDPPCANSAECEARSEFGPGSICNDPGCGACGQVCVRPCPA